MDEAHLKEVFANTFLCKRCGSVVEEDTLIATEGDMDIYRCRGCGKPVMVQSGKVKGVTRGG